MLRRGGSTDIVAQKFGYEKDDMMDGCRQDWGQGIAS